MTLLQISRDALRTVKKHTIGFTSVQSKVLSATENWPLSGAPFVGITQKFEIAQLSWDDNAFDEIVEIIKQRLVVNKWRRVVKALMILHYCLQEGSGRFTVWCKLNAALLKSLENYEYTLEDERDCGIEVRREARKIAALLHDPTFLDMRSHAEGEHISRQASMHRQENAEQFQRGLRTSLRRRGALMGFRKSNRSDITAASSSFTDSNRTLVDNAPVSVRQKVKTAISDTVELTAAMNNIKDIARQTSCPADFLDIMEAILESLASDDNNRHWGQVLRSIVLLRQCLSNVSKDVATYFQGNDEVMRLLYGFQDLQDSTLLGMTANAFRNSLSSNNEKEPLDPLDTPPAPELPEKAALDPPAYAILNPDETPEDSNEEDEPIHRVENPRLSYQFVRPLPIPPAPVDWSRLYTIAAGQRTPSILSGEDHSRSQSHQVSDSTPTELPRRLPPTPSVSAEPSFFAGPSVFGERSEEAPDEVPPSYSTALESPPAEFSPHSVTSSPVTTLVDLESEDDIEYVDEVFDAPSEDIVEELSDLDSDDIEYVDEDLNSAELDLEWPPLLNTETEARAAGESPVAYDAIDESEIVRTTPLVQPTSRDTNHIMPPPPSNITEDIVPSDPLSLSTRPSISITVSPPPPRTENVFDSPDATLSSSSSSPPSSSLVRCLTGLVRRRSEPACARGGYSDVWKGKLKSRLDSEHEEDVAIKVLRAVRVQSGSCPISRMHKRMARETSIWSKLDHPNIVPLRGYSLEEDGTPAIVSRWMENGDVLTYLTKHHFADRRKLVRQVAKGLLYLHSQSPPVVHGDLKGGNVLIDREGDAALCDFGMSIFLMDCQTMSSTSSNAAVGTLRWCAPELLSSDVPLRTLATDVWAFASLSLEILTGRIPFYNCTNDVKVIQDIAQGKTPARENYPELPMDNRFWEVLEACWKQDPEERPTMEQLQPLIFDDEMFSALNP